MSRLTVYSQGDQLKASLSSGVSLSGHSLGVVVQQLSVTNPNLSLAYNVPGTHMSTLL
jgi:hypothetical protein